MAVRGDQLHSHQFARRRVVAALAGRDPARPPASGTGPAIAGVMVACLALAAVGVYGLLRPRDDGSWRDGGSVVVERESGARFVYRDGVLHPVLNYSSALLILGSAQPRSALVARAALAGVPRGAPLGIPGAPDLLPAPADLVTDPWTVCSRTASPGPESVLLVGWRPVSPSALDGRALVVAEPSGGLHLLWRRHRYAIRDPDLVLAAFAWPRQSAAAVAPALLNAVPAGPDLGRIAIDGAGRRSAALPGRRIGQVVVVENSGGGRQFAVVAASGLAEITQVQADLLLAGGGGAAPVRMSQSEYATAPRAPAMVPGGEAAPPATTPELAAPSGAVCASFVDGGGPPEIAAVATVPRAGELRAPAAPAVSSAPADWVVVPPGRGAVVESLAGPTAPVGALSLVTDLGVRFPIPAPEILAVLGYPDARPWRLPAAVVALLPTGRALDPSAAALPVIPGQ
jgi:type VII secretion protein EccB